MIAGITASTRRRASAMLLAPTNLVATLVETTPTLPTVIGEAFGGGYYIGDIVIADGGADDGTYAVIMAGIEGQPGSDLLTWKDSPTVTLGTDSNTNGFENSVSMQGSNNGVHPAARHCLAHDGGGHADWYLPSTDELNLAWTGRSHLAALMMEPQYYWTSTQQSPTNAWRQSFYDGSQSNATKSASFRVRPVCRFKRP